MTVLVGVLCSDGVVVGSDSSATFGASPVQKTIELAPVKKVFILDGQAIVAGTGAIGLSQRFIHHAGDVVKNWSRSKTTAIQFATQITREAIKDFQSSGAPANMCGALVAFEINGEYALCEFDAATLQPELKRNDDIWFASMGCGQPIADPFLGFLRRVFMKDGKQPTLSEGLLFVTWALRHAIELNAGGIQGPMQIATLVDDGGTPKATLLSEGDVDGHEESAQDAERHLGEFATKLQDANAGDIPNPSPEDEQE